jgi:hypothetical protein
MGRASLSRCPKKEQFLFKCLDHARSGDSDAVRLLKGSNVTGELHVLQKHHTELDCPACGTTSNASSSQHGRDDEAAL